ncbi:hypothetical protein RB653_001057 [Dictyostelium firmibasis]|uniref:FHA domain-containing protein n=1 Tax=Dictyostelium firmibasis TaxID=79012 RepID=A0AAN7YR56_9MYCE
MQKFDAFLVYSYLPLLPIVYNPFIYLYDKNITLGRGKKADVEFFSKSTSRDHSSITVVVNETGEKEYFIEDSDTLNGTFINSIKIESKTKLSHNDRIRFGSASSEIRYTFKLNSKLSIENINIFKFLKSLETDKEKLKSHPLSKLFTPLLIASSSSKSNNEDDDLILLEKDNKVNTSINNNNSVIKKNNSEYEKTKLIDSGSTLNKSTIKKPITTNATKSTTNKKRKHEEVREKDQEEDNEEDVVQEKDKEEEKHEIFEKDSLVQYKLTDNSCEIGTVVSFSKYKNSYLVQSESNKKYKINNGEIEKAWVKKLEFENVKTKSRVRVFYNEKWYRGIILEKRCNPPGGRLKYEYFVRFIDIKQPHIWIGGSKIFKE